MPFWLRFNFDTHVYLIGLTPLMPALLRFFENSDLSELPSFFPFFFLHFNECEMQMSYTDVMMRMSSWEYAMMLMYPCRCAMNANARLGLQ